MGQSVTGPWFKIELLLREALVTGVKHGSHGDPANQICCHLRLRSCRITIAVRDEGDGFDWRAAGRLEIDESRPSGLGIHIYREYATRVRFNNRGNGVTLLKRF